MTGKMVFVSGPVSSDPYGSVRQGIKAFDELRAKGHVPILPQLSVFQEIISPRDYEDWMAYFDAIIERCDVLLRLEGISSGADREVARAMEMNKEIWFEDGPENEQHKLFVERRIWRPNKPEVRVLMGKNWTDQKYFHGYKEKAPPLVCTNDLDCPACHP
jgi:hypothetical protein